MTTQRLTAVDRFQRALATNPQCIEAAKNWAGDHYLRSETPGTAEEVHFERG